MSGSTFQPPINLDPTQDAGQQTAFINQNFQSLAAGLQANSFRVIDQGTAVIGQSSHAGGSISTVTTVASFSATYSFIPILLAFIVSNTGDGNIGNIWGTGAFVPQQFGATVGGITFTNGIAERRNQIVSTSGVTFNLDFINGTAGNQTNFGYTLKWYALSNGTA